MNKKKLTIRKLRTAKHYSLVYIVELNKYRVYARSTSYDYTTEAGAVNFIEQYKKLIKKGQV